MYSIPSSHFSPHTRKYYDWKWFSSTEDSTEGNNIYLGCIVYQIYGPRRRILSKTVSGLTVGTQAQIETCWLRASLGDGILEEVSRESSLEPLSRTEESCSPLVIIEILSPCAVRNIPVPRYTASPTNTPDGNDLESPPVSNAIRANFTVNARNGDTIAYILRQNIRCMRHYLQTHRDRHFMTALDPHSVRIPLMSRVPVLQTALGFGSCIPPHEHVDGIRGMLELGAATVSLIDPIAALLARITLILNSMTGPSLHLANIVSSGYISSTTGELRRCTLSVFTSLHHSLFFKYFVSSHISTLFNHVYSTVCRRPVVGRFCTVLRGCCRWYVLMLSTGQGWRCPNTEQRFRTQLRV